MNGKQITRRQLGATLAGAAALLGQTRTPEPTPNEELEAARERIRRDGLRLASIGIPMDREPAFQFQA
ncbi:MAG: hypothetical protein WD696_00575 [Bryobacteraceae bacterium]